MTAPAEEEEEQMAKEFSGQFVIDRRRDRSTSSPDGSLLEAAIFTSRRSDAGPGAPSRCMLRLKYEFDPRSPLNGLPSTGGPQQLLDGPKPLLRSLLHELRKHNQTLLNRPVPSPLLGSGRDVGDDEDEALSLECARRQLSETVRRKQAVEPEASATASLNSLSLWPPWRPDSDWQSDEIRSEPPGLQAVLHCVEVVRRAAGDWCICQALLVAAAQPAVEPAVVPEAGGTRLLGAPGPAAQPATRLACLVARLTGERGPIASFAADQIVSWTRGSEPAEALVRRRPLVPDWRISGAGARLLATAFLPASQPHLQLSLAPLPRNRGESTRPPAPLKRLLHRSAGLQPNRTKTLLTPRALVVERVHASNCPPAASRRRSASCRLDAAPAAGTAWHLVSLTPQALPAPTATQTATARVRGRTQSRVHARTRVPATPSNPVSSEVCIFPLRELEALTHHCQRILGQGLQARLSRRQQQTGCHMLLESGLACQSRGLKQADSNDSLFTAIDQPTRRPAVDLETIYSSHFFRLNHQRHHNSNNNNNNKNYEASSFWCEDLRLMPNLGDKQTAFLSFDQLVNRYQGQKRPFSSMDASLPEFDRPTSGPCYAARLKSDPRRTTAPRTGVPGSDPPEAGPAMLDSATATEAGVKACLLRGHPLRLSKWRSTRVGHGPARTWRTKSQAVFWLARAAGQPSSRHQQRLAVRTAKEEALSQLRPAPEEKRPPPKRTDSQVSWRRPPLRRSSLSFPVESEDATTCSRRKVRLTGIAPADEVASVASDTFVRQDGYLQNSLEQRYRPAGQSRRTRELQESRRACGVELKKTNSEGAYPSETDLSEPSGMFPSDAGSRQMRIPGLAGPRSRPPQHNSNCNNRSPRRPRARRSFGRLRILPAPHKHMHHYLAQARPAPTVPAGPSPARGSGRGPAGLSLALSSGTVNGVEKCLIWHEDSLGSPSCPAHFSCSNLRVPSPRLHIPPPFHMPPTRAALCHHLESAGETDSPGPSLRSQPQPRTRTRPRLPQSERGDSPRPLHGVRLRPASPSDAHGAVNWPNRGGGFLAPTSTALMVLADTPAGHVLELRPQGGILCSLEEVEGEATRLCSIEWSAVSIGPFAPDPADVKTFNSTSSLCFSQSMSLRVSSYTNSCSLVEMNSFGELEMDQLLKGDFSTPQSQVSITNLFSGGQSQEEGSSKCGDYEDPRQNEWLFHAIRDIFKVGQTSQSLLELIDLFLIKALHVHQSKCS